MTTVNRLPGPGLLRRYLVMTVAVAAVLGVFVLGGFFGNPRCLGGGDRACCRSVRSTGLSHRRRLPGDLHHHHRQHRHCRGGEFFDGYRVLMPGRCGRHAAVWLHHHRHHVESACHISRPMQRNYLWRRQQSDLRCLRRHDDSNRNSGVGRHRKSVHRFGHGRWHPADSPLCPGSEYDKCDSHPVQWLGERRRRQHQGAMRCDRFNTNGRAHHQQLSATALRTAGGSTVTCVATFTRTSSPRHLPRRRRPRPHPHPHPPLLRLLPEPEARLPSDPGNGCDRRIAGRRGLDGSVGHYRPCGFARDRAGGAAHARNDDLLYLAAASLAGAGIALTLAIRRRRSRADIAATESL